MRHYLPQYFWVVLGLIATKSFAQISVDFPADRAVFQRDKNNSAVVYIAGTYTKVIDRVEAKVTAINGGESTDWKIIHSNPQGGLYSGNLTLKGGWYRLEVRAFKSDQIVDTRPVEHVGVGEVIMIAGQSNGQGYNNFGAQSAQDDRVNAIAHNNTLFPEQTLPEHPLFTHINADSDISPRGYSAWCWGRLGDRLVSKLGVPVLFYNVAWNGTAVRAWRESITGTAWSVYAPIPIEPSGMPYGNLRAVIQRYTPITGLRGILWIQGEADNFKDTDSKSYFNDLKTVIETSRNESGRNISWMVSITSYDNFRGVDHQVTDGQRRVINNVSNVFQGPVTDEIQIPRQDAEGVHFNNDGLQQLGDAWYDRLNDDFFSRSEPFQGIEPLRIAASCVGNGNLRLRVENAGLSSHNWNNGQSSDQIEVGNGAYYASARDGRGNYIFSPILRFNESFQPNRPTITLEGSNPVCLGNTATLIANTSENIRWNTGATSDKLPVTTGGDYFVTTTNAYGCEATSDKITMRVVNSPLPAKPKIAASGVLTFCDGGEVNLTSDSKLTNVWSNGTNAASITVRTTGEFKVRALDDQGCYSPESDAINVKVNPLPQKPSIAIEGETTFCEGGNVKLTSNYNTGNIWSNQSTAKEISITETGKFTLIQRDANGCESTSDAVDVKVNPLPPMPVITALRPTTFCDRDYTLLRSSEAYSYVWSNGTNNREIEVRESGSYTISSKDENGCVSPASAVTQVVKNPLPAKPVITADGPLEFCADLSVNLRSSTAEGFLWSNGASTQTLKVNTAGNFTVQTINEFQCYSDPSNSITTRTLALPPAPIVQALGATMICDGDTVALVASKGENFFWNNGLEGSEISVRESGNFSARVQDSKGCYSPYSGEISIEVKPAPSAPVIKKTGVYTLKAENNLNDGIHQWKYNNIELPETSDVLKAVRGGSYVVNNTIVYSPALTCFSEFSEPFTFILDTSTPGFVAYPNPNATNQVTVETLVNAHNAEIQIIDVRGTIHKTFKVNRFDRQYMFNLDNLSSGTYFIRIISTTINATQKLLIVR